MAFVACIMVRDHKALKRIGESRVVNRLVNQAVEVRGITKLVVATIPELGNRVRNAIDEDVEVVEIPDNLTYRPARILSGENGIACSAETVLCVFTNAPFLTTARMEECVHVVRTKKAKGARTVQRLILAQSVGPDVDRLASVVVRGAIAYDGSLAGEWPATFAEVEVGCLEALDVTTSDGERMAEAYAFSVNV